MQTKLRIARPTNDLDRISRMYSEGLNLKILGSFENHSGFDGIILGDGEVDYHFEFTHERGQEAPRANSPEQLIIFYTKDVEHTGQCSSSMIAAGFKIVKSHNPYWDQHGFTFEDFEGYRVVLCHRQLSHQ